MILTLVPSPWMTTEAKQTCLERLFRTPKRANLMPVGEKLYCSVELFDFFQKKFGTMSCFPLVNYVGT